MIRTQPGASTMLKRTSARQSPAFGTTRRPLAAHRCPFWEREHRYHGQTRAFVSTFRRSRGAPPSHQPRLFTAAWSVPSLGFHSNVQHRCKDTSVRLCNQSRNRAKVEGATSSLILLCWVRTIGSKRKHETNPHSAHSRQPHQICGENGRGDNGSALTTFCSLSGSLHSRW
jgi:hypothetical protein